MQNLSFVFNIALLFFFFLLGQRKLMIRFSSKFQKILGWVGGFYFFILGQAV